MPNLFDMYSLVFWVRLLSSLLLTAENQGKRGPLDRFQGSGETKKIPSTSFTRQKQLQSEGGVLGGQWVGNTVNALYII